jgi:hypothetical protein
MLNVVAPRLIPLHGGNRENTLSNPQIAPACDSDVAKSRVKTDRKSHFIFGWSFNEKEQKNKDAIKEILRNKGDIP